MSNITFNLSNFDFANMSYENVEIDMKGVYNSVCNQTHDYIVNMGIKVVIAYVVISWFLWWFFKWGYKYFPNKNLGYLGNLHSLQTQIYWDSFIRGSLSKLLIGYIVVVIFLNW